VHVDQRGSGRPIVLVHGWGAGAVTWSRQLASLADQFRVFAPDLPGFGRTPPDGRPDAAGFSHALRELIDGHRLDGVVLAGWSMGGLVVLDYASRFDSHALAAVIVVDVSLRPHANAEFGRRSNGWERRFHTEREAVVREVTEMAFVDADLHRADVEALVEDALRGDHDAAFAAFANLRKCDFRDALPAIRVPLLFLFGAASKSTTLSDFELCAALAPSARTVRIAGCGHALMIENPTRFDSELRAFTAAQP
jgi:non-heme chloroperoxidase